MPPLLLLAVVLLVVLTLVLAFLRLPDAAELFHSGDVDGDFLNDEEALLHLAEEFDFTTLSPEEQQLFLKGEEFCKQNPPNPQHNRGGFYTSEKEQLLRENGINAFHFEQESDILTARYVVEDRTDVNFVNNDAAYSTVTATLNYPLPVKDRSADTIYFEVKVFEFCNEANAHFGIGLVTKPYPLFRLPGYNSFSVAYELTGNLKINKPFPTPLQQHMGERSVHNALVLPPLLQSDVVGFGYVMSSGTIFITRNGKKLLDVMKGCFVDMYPAIGCFSTNARFQANFGQLGFVWIEANVRRFGFFSTSDRKLKGDRGLAALPQYGKVEIRRDKLLDKGDELPPHYPEEEVDFFGRVGTSRHRKEGSVEPKD